MQRTIPLENGKYYHIYNRGINSEKLFKEPENFEYFLNLYDRHISPVADTFAWCLMTNHFHLLIRIKEQNEISQHKTIEPSQSFSNLFNAYTKAINKRFNRHGALFERPFRRKIVEDETYFRNIITYIHNNPVHHGYCEHPLGYPWSSYITCTTEKPTKLNREQVLELFDDLDNFIYCHELKSYVISVEHLSGF